MIVRLLSHGRRKVLRAWPFFSVLLTVMSARRDDLIVNTAKGRVRGVRYFLPTFNKAVDAYLGIPFAKPPVQHLRFRHPVPIEKWRGTHNATKLPNSCYQSPDTFFGDFPGATMWNPPTKVSEDCLYLNVWVPKMQKRIRRSAVLVWIFGGGFYGGTPTLNLYDGKILAALNEIIVVSIGYRVGALGFLSLAHPGAPGNAGMFDQLMGLEWIQQNIKYFGGNPHNVTLMGESAGSFSVSLHLLSPLSRNKFYQAIMQSGTANMPWGTLSQGEGRRRAIELAIEYLGCPKHYEIDEIVEFLRGISPHRLVLDQWVSRGIMQFPFLPVIDGAFLVETPYMSLKRRSFKKCPVLLGSNLNEGSYFIIYELSDLVKLNRSTMDREQYVSSMGKLFYHYEQYPQVINAFGMEAITFQYANWQDPDGTIGNLRSLDNAVGDCHFLCHVNEFAHVYAEAGLNVYMYYFTQRYMSNPWPKWMGVLHGDEIIFVFGEALKPGLNYTSKEKQLSREIMRYWTNFAKSGDPNRRPGKSSLNAWPLHTPHGHEYLELNVNFLNEPDKSRAVSRGPRAKECAFWKHYLPRLVISTDDITEAEKDWKLQFNEWSSRYIVDWKVGFDMFEDLVDKDRTIQHPPNTTLACSTQISGTGTISPTLLLLSTLLLLTTCVQT